MKLLRYGPEGSEKPGCLDSQGHIRDLSEYVQDITFEALTPTSLDSLRKLNLENLPIIPGNPRIGACIQQVRNFLCIGLNYLDHAAETNSKPPTEPVLFNKVTSAVCGPYDNLIIPFASSHTDWEVELGVIIGSHAKRVQENEALRYVAGYCVVNDVSERHYQKNGTGQWVKGKSCDTFGPIGPWLVTTDEITNPQQLPLWLEVDGKRYQNSNTDQMIFSVSFLISYLSHFFTLQPGDIISTGTPSGVGLGQKPQPIYLKPGQEIKLGVEGLGEQEHRVIAEQV